MESVSQNQGVCIEVWGWVGYNGGVVSLLPWGLCRRVPCSSSRLAASLGSEEQRPEGHAPLLPLPALTQLPWELGLRRGSCPGWAGSNWCCFTGRRMQSAKLGPSPPRLLTEEEYRVQGEVETRKALEELRNYCRSPDFSAWTAVSRIQSPKR